MIDNEVTLIQMEKEAVAEGKPHWMAMEWWWTWKAIKAWWGKP